MTDDIGGDLAAFLDEHRTCGTLDIGFTGEPELIWMACYLTLVRRP
jgi:hypothetical protein